MIDYASSANLMTNAQPGADPQEWPRYPGLDDSGNIRLLPGEEMLAVQAAKRIAQEGFALPESDDLGELIHNLQQRKVVTSLRACTVYVTNLRTAWIVDKPLTAGTLVTGHVWHAWLDWVEFNPRQSFFIDAALSLHFRQDFGDGTSGWFGHFVEFGFEKTFDPARLATTLAHAAADHRLGFGATEATHEELRELLASPPPPSPAKGESAIFTFPTCVVYPLVPASLDPDHGGDWTSPSSDE